MVNYKYEVNDKIINTDGQAGVITSKETSMIDHEEIPSYWVLYGPEIHPDGYPRNTWEISIKSKV